MNLLDNEQQPSKTKIFKEEDNYDQPLLISTVLDNENDDQCKHNKEQQLAANLLPWYAYPILVLAAAAGAMDGPFSQPLATSNPFLRMAWKFQGVLLIFAIFEFGRLVFGKSKIRETIVTIKQQPYQIASDFMLTSIGLIGMQSFLSWGSIYTIMSHANLFSSLCAIIIVSYRLLTMQKVTIAEIVGSIIAIIGCIITGFDNSAQKVDPNTQNIFWGNLLSTMSALFAVIYIVKGQQVSRKVDPIHYIIILTFIVSMLFIVVGPIFSKHDFLFNFDRVNGLFGWMHSTNIIYCAIVLSLMNGCGTLGLQFLCFKQNPILIFIRSILILMISSLKNKVISDATQPVKIAQISIQVIFEKSAIITIILGRVYFTGVIVGTTMLLESFFSQIYGILLGLDEFPGIFTYIGGIIIIGGLYLLLVYQEAEEEKVKQESIQKD